MNQFGPTFLFAVIDSIPQYFSRYSDSSEWASASTLLRARWALRRSKRHSRRRRAISSVHQYTGSLSRFIRFLGMKASQSRLKSPTVSSDSFLAFSLRAGGITRVGPCLVSVFAAPPAVVMSVRSFTVSTVMPVAEAPVASQHHKTGPHSATDKPYLYKPGLEQSCSPI